jgi:hypothetical protein
VRDAAALGISEDDLWAGVDSEFERLTRQEGGNDDADAGGR